MNSNIRISGVYDQKTIKLLTSLNVRDIVFDLRPRSFSFIQGYKLLELLENNFDFSTNYYFEFSNEKSDVINYLISEIEKRFGLRGTKGFPTNIHLEFSGTEEISFCNSFSWSYLRHVDQDTHFDLIHDDKICGIVVDYKNLVDLHNKNEISPFLNKINQWTIKQTNRQNLKFFLNLNWSDAPMVQIIELFKTFTISLPINNLVEVTYREVDIPKLSKTITHIQEKGIV